MEVRFFKKSERQLLLDSIDRLWRHEHIYVRNPEVLEHLVLNTPYRAEFAGEDNYSFLGLWHQEKVVGLLGVIPQEINAWGTIKKSATFTVWITDQTQKQAFNGLDLHNYLLDKKLDMRLCLGISSIASKMYKFLHWYLIEELPRWIVVNRVQETMENLLPSDSMKEYLPQVHRVKLNTSLHIENDILDAKAWNDFYFSIFAPISIGTCRDYKFLRWRYMESPVLKYHFLTVRDVDGKYQGLAVLRIETICNGTYRIGRLLEFIAVNTDAAILLASAVIEYDSTVLMWDFYCLSDITAFGLESVGFRKIPVWMDKIIMPTRFQPVDYENMKLNGAIYLGEIWRRKLNPMSQYQWYITKGDADQDRAN